MSLLYLILGVCLFVLIALDIIKTTLTSNGGGAMTNFVSKKIWKAFFIIAGRNGKSRILEYAGPSILILIIFLWILGLWLGMLFVLLSEFDSIRHGNTQATAGWVEKLYYAGYTLSTLGIGDYAASNNVFRVVTCVAAFSGLAFITSSITYFLPVLSAVNMQSKISLYITSLGKSPQEILVNSWNGKDFSSFFDIAPGLSEMIMKHTLDHNAYPVIHYFHNSKEKLSIQKSLVTLDEVVQILENAVSPDAGINSLKLNMLRTVLNEYINTIEEFPLRGKPGKGKPPLPDFDYLTMKGIPLKNTGAGYLQQQDIVQHRRALTKILQSGGWSWKNIYKN